MCLDEAVRAFALTGVDAMPLPDERRISELRFTVVDRLEQAADSPVDFIRILMSGKIPPVAGGFDRVEVFGALGEFTPDYWRDLDGIDRVVAYLRNDPRMVGVPNNRSESVAQTIAGEAMINREVFRRIERGLPPLPRVVRMTSNR